MTISFPINQLKFTLKFIFKPSKQLLKEIRKKKILYRKFKKLKLLNKPNMEQVWEKYKQQRNLVTKLAKFDRRQNVINDLKQKSKLNDLKGIWKTIKEASNISSSAKRSNNKTDLNAEVLNEYFCEIGPKIHGNICDNDDKMYDYYLDSACSSNFNTFEKVSSEMICTCRYFNQIPSDKSSNDNM